MRGKHPIPIWVYITLVIFALAPVVAVVVIGKYTVPKISSAVKSTAAAGKEKTVEYQGQTIQLSKSYSDFDEYKADPNNIAAGETARVQQMVASAPIWASYPDLEALEKAMGELQFPGYGMGKFQCLGDKELLHVYCIEIPRANQERIVVYEQIRGSMRYGLLDDFLSAPGIRDVRWKPGQLLYHNTQTRVWVTRPLAAK